MTTHSPLPTTIGCSWGWTPADPTTPDPYFEKMAAQGQNFFAASGDSSTWSKSNEAWPADDANVVSVGGTDLVTASAPVPGSRRPPGSDSGGGISPDKIAIPSWQQLSASSTPPTRARQPAQRPGRFGQCQLHLLHLRRPEPAWPTSTAAPASPLPCGPATSRWSTSSCQANGIPTLGFINPTIYAQKLTSAYATDFHDITSGNPAATPRDRLRPGHRLGQPQRRAHPLPPLRWPRALRPEPTRLP
jgi:hypothetical protein